MEKNNTGEGGRKEKQNGRLKCAACHCTACSSPLHKAKLRETAGSTVSKAMHRRRGGACMHKTDGKLFCVAAPIPGAGAGEGEWGAEVHEMGSSTGSNKCSPLTTVRTGGGGGGGGIKKKKVMFSQTTDDTW